MCLDWKKYEYIDYIKYPHPWCHRQQVASWTRILAGITINMPVFIQPFNIIRSASIHIVHDLPQIYCTVSFSNGNCNCFDMIDHLQNNNTNLVAIASINLAIKHLMFIWNFSIIMIISLQFFWAKIINNCVLNNLLLK